MLGQFFQHVIVVAENLYRQFRLSAFEHFVETHLDGLSGKNVVIGIYLLEHRANLFVQFRLCARTARCLGPFNDWHVENVNIALVGRHWIGGDVARSDARKDACDFRELREQPVLNFDVRSQRFLHAHANRLVKHGGNRTFIELGHKLSAQPGEQPKRPDEQQGRRSNREPAPPQCEVERWCIQFLQAGNDTVVTLVNPSAQSKRTEHRHERESEHQRAA